MLDRAKSRLLTRAQVESIASGLESGTADDPYTAIHILGLMHATEYEELVAHFLKEGADPMVARIALQVLCSHWGLARSYRDEILKFCQGVSWDPDDDVRLAALSAAGELCREAGDPGLTGQLLKIFESVTEPRLVRQAAYFAVARAAGREWAQLPPASRHLNFENDIDPSVISWAKTRLAR